MADVVAIAAVMAAGVCVGSVPIASAQVSAGAAVAGAAAGGPSAAWFGEAGQAVPDPGPAVSYGAGGLQPLLPTRLLDTRSGVGAPQGRVSADGEVTLAVTGRGGVPPVGVGAVVLNVTAVGATERSFVTVWPTGAGRPVASNLNVAPGDTVPNLVVVKVGAGGRVSLFNRFGSVDLVADVAGWFPEGAGVEPVVPARILDTRAGLGAAMQRVGPDGMIDLHVTGRGGVPTSGVGAVVINVTAVGPSATSFVTVWPSGSGRPTASNLNVVPGETVPNLVVVKVGAGGRVSLFNRFGDVDLVADVAGWFPDDGGFVPLEPQRILDTRSGNGAAMARVGVAGVVDLQVAGRGGVPVDGVGAVVLNVTAVGPTAGSFVTVWPSGVDRPLASNLNVVAGDTVPNLVIVKVGAGGRVSLFNRFGDVDLLADVAGWFPDGTAATTTLVPGVSTVLGGPGDVVSFSGSTDTGATVTLSASADVPQPGGYLAVFPHGTVPGGASGRVASVSPNSDGSTIAVLEPASVQDMFADLDTHGGFAVDLDELVGAPATSGAITQASPGSWECGGSVTLSSLPTFALGGLDATFDYDLSERYARVLLTMEPSIAWQLRESAALSCTLQLWEDKELGWIGPFEISGGGASLSVSMSAGAKSADMGGSMPIQLGFEHRDGDTTDLSSVDVVASGSNAASANASASVGLSFSTKGKAFGIAGLSLSAGPKLTATLTAPTCITLGLSATIGLSGEVGKWMLTWKVDLGTFTIDLGEVFRTGCDAPLWSGTMTVHFTAKYPREQDPPGLYTVTEESATLVLRPELSGDDDYWGAGSYAASFSGSGVSTSYDPQCDTGRSDRTVWSATNVVREHVFNLTWNPSAQAWWFLAWGAVPELLYPGDSGAITGSWTIFACYGAPERSQPFGGVVLQGDRFAEGALVDDDPRADRLVGTTSWTIENPPSVPPAIGGPTDYWEYWEYTITYDLTQVKL